MPWFLSTPEPNAHWGVPNDIASPMRTVKLSMRYAF